MRILLVHNRYQQRGGEDVAFEAERDLLVRGKHEVFVFERHNREIAEYNAWQRLDLVRRTLWATDSIAAIRRVLEDQRPDVVHFHNTFPLISPAAYSVCAAFRIPVIQTLPNYRLICVGATLQRDGSPCELCVGRNAPMQGVRHACYRASRLHSGVATAMLVFHRMLRTWQSNVDIFIALTEFSRRKLIEGGLPAGRIVVKPNFVHPDPGPRSTDSGYALFVGRLSREKGVSTLLKAWKNVDGIKLKIVGDGPLRPQVEHALTTADPGRIEYLGWRSRDEVFALLREASFLLFPTECYEGFPMTLAEAFACGTPVIASRLGSVQEIVRDGVSGLFFQPGDPSSLAAVTERLWADSHLRVRLGQGARAQYDAHYTAEKNHEMTMRILEDAISKKA